jgi:uncharacterized protein (TIGR02145 family)
MSFSPFFLRVSSTALLLSPALLAGCGNVYDIEVISGGDQAAASGRMLDTPVDVYVTLEGGATVSSSSAMDTGVPTSNVGGAAAGIEVVVEVTTGGGSVDRTTAVTDEAGRAQFAWTVGDAGPQELQISIAGQEKNSAGIAATALSVGEYTDARDGEVYRTVASGGLTWMADHLRHVTEGSMVTPDRPEALWGRLYRWSDASTACPDGWRLPTDVEFTAFEASLGIGGPGDRMKNDTGWDRHNGVDGNGSNSAAFNALPNGRVDDVNYEGQGIVAGMWTSTEVTEASAITHELQGDSADPSAGERLKVFAISVRCVTES